MIRTPEKIAVNALQVSHMSTWMIFWYIHSSYYILRGLSDKFVGYNAIAPYLYQLGLGLSSGKVTKKRKRKTSYIMRFSVNGHLRNFAEERVSFHIYC